MKVAGLWVPLVTPMYHGEFDEQSARKVVEATGPYVDGYVVALSTGEGDVFSADTWTTALRTYVSTTQKPVVVGVFADGVAATLDRVSEARQLGACAVVIPTQGTTDDEIVSQLTAISKETTLPIVVYNTEQNPITSIATVVSLDALPNIIALKDSSGNETFFRDLVSQRSSLHMTLLQGLEHKLLQSKGCDGYMIALGNVEPELCRRMFDHPTEEINTQIMEKFWQYNLGGDWYVTIKALLYAKDILRSAEQVHQTLKL